MKRKSKILGLFLILILITFTGCTTENTGETAVNTDSQYADLTTFETSPSEPADTPNIEEVAVVTDDAVEKVENVEKTEDTDPVKETVESTGNEILDTVPDCGSIDNYEINGNEPYFTAEDMTTEPFEEYSDLDELGRCGVAYANICQELMPTEKRGDIGMIKPSGWNQAKYPGVISDNPPYLYNRCHLIGFQLAGENANEKNLITGTRYFNVIGMLPYEDQVADYVHKTGNHVLYRVTPVYEGDDLVAKGVLMEALSVEDNGAGVKFNAFVYNYQPGIVINYADGSSYEDTDYQAFTDDMSVCEISTKQEKLRTLSEYSCDEEGKADYVLNTNTKKFHLPDCTSISEMSEKNKECVNDTRDNLLLEGYEPCKICNP